MQYSNESRSLTLTGTSEHFLGYTFFNFSSFSICQVCKLQLYKQQLQKLNKREKRGMDAGKQQIWICKLVRSLSCPALWDPGALQEHTRWRCRSPSLSLVCSGKSVMISHHLILCNSLLLMQEDINKLLIFFFLPPPMPFQIYMSFLLEIQEVLSSVSRVVLDLHSHRVAAPL